MPVQKKNQTVEHCATSPSGWLVAAVLAISIGAVYGRALNVPFIYDDTATILHNPSILRLWPIIGSHEQPGPLNPAPDFPTSGRPLVNLSFAINYAVGGFNTFGYHVVSVVIHFLSSLLLWAIVRRTLLLPYFTDRFSRSAGWLAFAVALLWALHPLQTEAVIYATQRTELMMALFYLATFYCSLRYWSADLRTTQRAVWLTLAILACLAGMASKEVMVSAPLMVLLFDRTFVSGSLVSALRRSWPLYAGLAATWILVALLMLGAPHGLSAGFGHRTPAYVYWLTQSKVFLMYLKLVIWPWPLLISYELPHLETLAASWMYMLPVLALGITTLLLLWRNHPVGFLLTWVFAILAPTSLVPIVTEVAAERRMYLPLAAIVVLAVVGGYLLTASVRRSWRQQPRKNSSAVRGQGDGSSALVVFPAIFVSVLFAIVDVAHLETYRDEKTLWLEVIRRQPHNLVAHNNLSDLQIHAGQLTEAVATTEKSLALRPNQPLTYNNLGVALEKMGRHAEAVENFQQAVGLKPDYVEAHNNLGLALTNIGRHQEAICEFEKTLALQHDHLNAMYNMGIALTNMGRYPEAIEQYERVLSRKPNYTAARINMAATFHLAGSTPQAIEQFQMVLSAEPDNVDAHKNLGLIYSAAGRSDDAVRHFEHALRCGANGFDIHHRLAEMYSHIGQTNDAITHYQMALRLKPDDLQAAIDLAQALASVNRSSEAIATAEKALDVARRSGQVEAAKQIEEWLRQYHAQQRPPSSQ